MKYLILTFLFVTNSVFADVITSGPWKFYTGTSITDEFELEQDCIDKLESQVPQSTVKIYNCEFRHRLVVSAIDDGHPDPIPDPVPPSTGTCDATINNTSNINASFALISDGQTLCLDDGIYYQWANIPSNKFLAPVNRNKAIIDGSTLPDANWKYGTLTMEGNNSGVDGLRVRNAPYHWDACKISGTNNTMTNTSCSHGGKHKHKINLIVGGSGHLIENSWFYGEGRYNLQCYNGNNITFRNNVVRWDKTIAGEPSEPNAAMSNYSCNDMLWEGNLSLDYGVPDTRMKHCGDFCMSTNANQPNLRVQYIGNIVVNHAKNTDNNFGLRADQKGQLPSSDILIKDFYVNGSNAAIAVNPLYKNVTVQNCNTRNVLEDGGLGNGNAVTCGNAPVAPPNYINQALIKENMCAIGERQSTWCGTNLNLDGYIRLY